MREDAPVGEEGAAAEQEVGLAAREALKALEELVVDLLRAKLVDEVVVVDRHLSAHERRAEKESGSRGTEDAVELLRQEEARGTKGARRDCLDGWMDACW